jgi:hypothetical protein
MKPIMVSVVMLKAIMLCVIMLMIAPLLNTVVEKSCSLFSERYQFSGCTYKLYSAGKLWGRHAWSQASKDVCGLVSLHWENIKQMGLPASSQLQLPVIIQHSIQNFFVTF